MSRVQVPSNKLYVDTDEVMTVFQLTREITELVTQVMGLSKALDTEDQIIDKQMEVV